VTQVNDLVNVRDAVVEGKYKNHRAPRLHCMALHLHHALDLTLRARPATRPLTPSLVRL
jgi:hypothetical protein